MTIDRRHLLLGSLSLPVFTACGGGGGGSSAAPTPAPPRHRHPAPAPALPPRRPTSPALKTYFASNFKIGMAADPNGYKNAIANPVILQARQLHHRRNAFARCHRPHGRQLQLGHGR